MKAVINSLMLLLLLPANVATALCARPSIGLRVCTNTACRKAGSADTLDLLTALASTATEIKTPAGVAFASSQAAFAASRIARCGCLGGCGSGPNVATTDESDDGGIFRDVYKPASAAALLSHICGLTIPDAAVKAWLRRMYAVRAMRANKAQEAHALLTEALTLSAPLKGDGSHLISLLLDERADVSEGLLRDAEAAAADRARAAQIRQLQQKQAAAAAA